MAPQWLAIVRTDNKYNVGHLTTRTGTHGLQLRTEFTVQTDVQQQCTVLCCSRGTASQKYSSCKAHASLVPACHNMRQYQPIQQCSRNTQFIIYQTTDSFTGGEVTARYTPPRCQLEMHNWRWKAVAATVRHPVMKVPELFSATFTTRERLITTRHEMNAITYCDQQIYKLKIHYYARHRHAKYTYSRQYQ